MKYKTVKALILIGITATSAVADAALISVDYLTANDGLLTRDTQTNLEWLDLTQTLNKNGSDVPSLTQSGGQFSGFSWATAEQFQTLYRNAGITTSSSSTTASQMTASIAKVRALQNMLGVTNLNVGSQATTYGTAGFVAGDRQYGLLAVYDYSGGTPDFYRAETYGVPAFERGAGTGLYLIRNFVAISAIPEPATWGLMMVGFAMVAGAVRYRRRATKVAYV